MHLLFAVDKMTGSPSDTGASVIQFVWTLDNMCQSSSEIRLLQFSPLRNMSVHGHEEKVLEQIMKWTPNGCSYSHREILTGKTEQCGCKHTKYQSRTQKTLNSNTGVKDSVPDGTDVQVQIALENLLSHHCGSSIQTVTSLQLACVMTLHEMTWNNNTQLQM